MKKMLGSLISLGLLFGLTSTTNAALLYFEDFNSSNGGYTHSGTLDEWQWNGSAWGTDWGGYYQNYSNQLLQSIVFALDIDTTQATTFSFDYWMDTERDWDFATVEYTTNGGSTWNTLGSGSGNSQGWVSFTTDISSIYNTTFQAGWRLTSDGSITDWGFYVDNVQLNGELNAPVPEPTTILLFGVGLAGLVAVQRRRTKKA